MNIAVRALTQDDWQDFKAARLMALKTQPEAYGSSYDKEKEFPEHEWKTMLDGSGKRIFGLFDKDALIGFAAIFTWHKDPSGQTGHLAMDFVAADYRGQKLSRLLYEARIAWALTQRQFVRLVIGYREGNEVSRRAMTAFGFQFVSKEKLTWPDGVEDYGYTYDLDLETLRLS